MKRLLISIIPAIASALMVSVFAQEEGDTESVIRIQDCQITLSTDRLLASGQSGIVAVVHVREGDRIRKGQLLAELDASVPKATLAVATEQAKNDVNIRYAIAASNYATVDYELSKHANKQVSDTFSRMELKKLELEKDRSVLEIEVSEHEFDVSQLRRDEAAALVASYRIAAPMNGIISHVYKSPGEAVQVGESVLQCRSTGVVYVEAQVDIHLLNLVTRGRKVKVIPLTPHPAVPNNGQGVEGTVFSVDVFADLGKTVRVLVDVDNQNGLLLAGTEAVIEVSTVLKPKAPVTARRD